MITKTQTRDEQLSTLTKQIHDMIEQERFEYEKTVRLKTDLLIKESGLDIACPNWLLPDTY